MMAMFHLSHLQAYDDFLLQVTEQEESLTIIQGKKLFSWMLRWGLKVKPKVPDVDLVALEILHWQTLKPSRLFGGTLAKLDNSR